MFLLYCDSSGTPHLKDQSRTYVLLGLAIHQSHWFQINRRLDRLKSRYCQPGETFELHVKQFAGDIREQSEIPKFENLLWEDRRELVEKLRHDRLAAEPNVNERERLLGKFRQTAPFIHLSRRERSQLLEDAIELIAESPKIHLFAEAVSKQHLAVVDGSIHAGRFAFEQVVFRFDEFLRHRHQRKLRDRMRPMVDNGLLIFDEDPSTEGVVRQQFDAFRLAGRLSHVIDVPFNADSARLAGLQLADVVAYVIRRYFDKAGEPGSYEEQHFRRISQRFDRDSLGTIRGVHHLVDFGNCSCILCQRRGRFLP